MTARIRATRTMFTASCLTLLALVVPRPARALDRFEIQVYEADINRPGRFGLEVHTNVVAGGTGDVDAPGRLPARGVARLTLEPAIGVTDFLELGGYLQFYGGPGEGLGFAGGKVRAKFVVPERLKWPVQVGLNVELGRVPWKIEAEGWANEFRPIVAWNHGRWLFDINPIFGYALTGPDAFKPDFEPCGKISWNTDRWFSVGVEYYAGLGLIPDGFSGWRAQEHIAYLVFDWMPPSTSEDETPWEFNVGLGKSLRSDAEADWVVKTIVGRSF